MNHCWLKSTEYNRIFDWYIMTYTHYYSVTENSFPLCAGEGFLFVCSVFLSLFFGQLDTNFWEEEARSMGHLFSCLIIKVGGTNPWWLVPSLGYIRKQAEQAALLCGLCLRTSQVAFSHGDHSSRNRLGLLLKCLSLIPL